MNRWMICANWKKRNLLFTVEMVEANTQEDALRIFRSRDFCLHSNLFQVYAIPETTFSEKRIAFDDAPLFASTTTVAAAPKCATAQAA